ncbi:MAG: hypothetical protein HQ528_00560, partial [Candidatus Marinimicrobia bacterium]|nr:hypothetical protein [Candidatus Neomarinimicrobiota bacterium]
WKSRTAALDLTNPEVEDWLRTVFRQLVDWGFDYFKIDFIFAGIRHGRRTRPEYSPVEAYRHGLQIIRETIGDRFLLGCGAPIGPSVGLVDALRVSEDVLEKWHNPLWEWLGRGCGVPSASGSLRNNIQRHYFHKKLWLNDPDCLLVRDRNSKLKPAEVRTLVTLLGLTGGMLFLSDDLTRLEPERLEWAKAVLPPTDLTGAPQGQFQNEYPELFRVKGRSAQILAITNWHKRSRIFDLAEYVKPGHFIFDFWGERFWKPASAKLLPHATLACQVTAFSGTPQVVGTTLHLTALADERLSQKFDGDKNLLFIKNEKLARATGKIWISVPTGYVYFGAELDGQIQTIESWEQGIVIAIDQSAPWQLTVKFIESPG